jgi:hypothetical protein
VDSLLQALQFVLDFKYLMEERRKQRIAEHWE